MKKITLNHIEASQWKRADHQSVIYFIQGRRGDPIKIGRTVNLDKRLKILQPMSWVRLRILGTMDGGLYDEQRLHKKFSQIRIRHEWFRATPELLKFIAENTTKPALVRSKCEPVASPSPTACPFCGDEIDRTVPNSKKYCSMECYWKFRSFGYRLEPQREAVRPRPTQPAEAAA